MKRSLRDQLRDAKAPQPRQEAYDAAAASLDRETLSSAQHAVEHYSKKTEAELMQELRRFRADGAFDDAALRDVAARLSPMLTPQQRERLFCVMRDIGT